MRHATLKATLYSMHTVTSNLQTTTSPAKPSLIGDRNQYFSIFKNNISLPASAIDTYLFPLLDYAGWGEKMKSSTSMTKAMSGTQ